MPELDLTPGTIHVRDEGEGPTLLFVHGLLVNGSLWRDVVAELSATHRCVVPDLPLGSHRTAMRKGADLTPPGLARLVAEIAERMGLEDVTLVGNDTGGAISQIVAANHPELLARLVLTNCDAYENFLPPAFRPMQWIAHVPGLRDGLIALTRLKVARRLSFAPVSKRIDDARRREWLAPSQRDAGVRRDVFAVLRGIDTGHTMAAIEKLKTFKKPVLLPWAVEDRFFKLAFAQRLANDLPHAHVEPIEDSRTFTPIDQPRRLAELIRAFVAEHNPPAAAAQGAPATTEPTSAAR